jgi:hypothetical protein
LHARLTLWMLVTMSDKNDKHTDKIAVDKHTEHVVQKSSHTLDHELAELDENGGLANLETLLKSPPLNKKK